MKKNTSTILGAWIALTWIVSSCSDMVAPSVKNTRSAANISKDDSNAMTSPEPGASSNPSASVNPNSSPNPGASATPAASPAAEAKGVGKITVDTNELANFKPGYTYAMYQETTMSGFTTKSFSIFVGNGNSITEDYFEKKVKEYKCHACDSGAPKCACGKNADSADCKAVTLSLMWSKGYPSTKKFDVKEKDYTSEAMITYTDGSASVGSTLGGASGTLEFTSDIPDAVGDSYTLVIDAKISSKTFKATAESKVYAPITAPTPPSCDPKDHWLEPIYE